MRRFCMCGIVAYVGSREAAPILLDGLKRLEYRGYDSAGIAVLSGDHFEIRRDVGKLNNLISKVSASPVHGTVGIGHTRWATHGEPSERNAHPHTSASGEVVVVHNGIVENFIPLKEELQAEGVTFTSDMPALLEHTRQMAFLDPGQMVVVTRDGFRASTLEGQPLDLPLQSVSWDPVAAEKGNYKHFMQKEIHEQVRSIGDTIAGRVDFECGRVMLPDLGLTPDYAKRIRRIVLTACGTAAHAGMVGRLLIERLAHIPAEVEIASEFRYRDPILDPDTVVIAISQSGETADTLAAMEEARRKGARLWSIVNVIGSQAMRMAAGFISKQSPPEIGVASTKAFTAPLVDLYMLAVLLGELRGVLDSKARRRLINDLRLVPDLVGQSLDGEPGVERVA